MIRNIDDVSSDVEIYQELSKYRHLPQIQNKALFGIIGITNNGESVLFPDSFQRGFDYEITSINQRPRTEFEIAGIGSYTSDGHLNYLSSFNKGREVGKELKTYLIIERLKKLSQENQGLKSMIHDLKTKVEDLMKKQKS